MKLSSDGSSLANDHGTSVPESNPDSIQTKIPQPVGEKNTQRFREFKLDGQTIAITGGGRGLGLTMAEALMEAGANGKLGIHWDPTHLPSFGDHRELNSPKSQCGV